MGEVKSRKGVRIRQNWASTTTIIVAYEVNNIFLHFNFSKMWLTNHSNSYGEECGECHSNEAFCGIFIDSRGGNKGSRKWNSGIRMRKLQVVVYFSKFSMGIRECWYKIRWLEVCWSGVCRNVIIESRDVKSWFRRGGGDATDDRRHIGRVSRQSRYCSLVQLDILVVGIMGSFVL